MHSHIASDSVAHSLPLPELAPPIHPVTALSRSGVPRTVLGLEGVGHTLGSVGIASVFREFTGDKKSPLQMLVVFD